jgi:hypothetical protein
MKSASIADLVANVGHQVRRLSDCDFRHDMQISALCRIWTDASPLLASFLAGIRPGMAALMGLIGQLDCQLDVAGDGLRLSPGMVRPDR